MCSHFTKIVGAAEQPETENANVTTERPSTPTIPGQHPPSQPSQKPPLPKSPNTPSTPEKGRSRTYGDTVSEVSGCSGCSATKPIKKLPPVHTEVAKWFQTMDTRSVGKITAKELQQAFETFQNKHFSDGVCKFVVRLFDLDKNGGLDIREFEQLYFYVKQWVNAFNSYDRGRSGFLDENEFDYALKQMDINFSPDFIKFLMTRTDPGCKRISMDQFIVTCVQIQRFTDEFKARDDKFSGTITLKYEDFLEMILKCL